MMIEAFAALETLPRWMAYLMEARGTGKPTKVPYAATRRGGPRQGFGSSTTPDTWGTRREAETRAADLASGSTAAMTGVGVALGTLDDDHTLAGIDLDSCIDDNGELAPWAGAILEAVPSYAERSPSGQGIKIFFWVPTAAVRPFLDAIGVERDAWGTKRSIAGLNGANHGPGIEVYAGARFFTVTEQLWDSRRQEIRRLDQEALERLANLIPTRTDVNGGVIGGDKTGASGVSLRSRARSAGQGRDSSRSARAASIAIAMAPDSYEEMTDGLRRHADPDIRAWVQDKGEAYNERELKRVWKRFVADRAKERQDALAELDHRPTAPDPPRATVAEAWEEPDLDVLRMHRRAPPSLPIEVFGAWGRWFVAVAQAAACPVDYVMMPFITGASGLIGHARWAQATPGWTEPPHLWGGVVGESGDGKSPGADCLLRDVLPQIEKTMRAGFPDRFREWQAASVFAKAALERWQSEVKDAEKKNTPPPLPPENTVPPEPKEPKLRQNDLTIERVATVLATAAPKGLLIVRDELSGWVMGMTAYNESGRAFWVEAYGGRPHRVERQQSDPIDIPRLAVAAYGGTQPDKLAEMLKAPDDGLFARFLWAWPEPIPFRLGRNTPHVEWAVAAFDRLRELDLQHGSPPQPIHVALEEDGQERIEQFARKMRDRREDAGGLLRSAYGKARGMALRLSLVLEFLWWCGRDGYTPPPAKISTEAFDAAARLVADYFLPMAERVYGDAAQPKTDRDATTLARWIRKNRPAEVYVRELQRKKRLPGLATAEDICAAADVLVEAGWLTPPLPGRRRQRARVAYAIRPQLWEALDATVRGSPRDTVDTFDPVKRR